MTMLPEDKRLFFSTPHYGSQLLIIPVPIVLFWSPQVLHTRGSQTYMKENIHAHTHMFPSMLLIEDRLFVIKRLADQVSCEALCLGIKGSLGKTYFIFLDHIPL